MRACVMSRDRSNVNEMMIIMRLSSQKGGLKSSTCRGSWWWMDVWFSLVIRRAPIVNFARVNRIENEAPKRKSFHHGTYISSLMDFHGKIVDKALSLISIF